MKYMKIVSIIDNSVRVKSGDIVLDIVIQENEYGKIKLLIPDGIYIRDFREFRDEVIQTYYTVKRSTKTNEQKIDTLD